MTHPSPDTPPVGTATWGPPGDRRSPYRYTLTRTWDPSLPTLVLGMTNPSTADEHASDPTITRCLGFARDGGFGRLVVWNLFAYRHPHVHALVRHHRDGIDVVGPANDRAIRRACREPGATVVCAWGPPRKVAAALRPRFTTVPAMLRRLGVALHVLALTEDGHPRHPLYLPGGLRPVAWEG